VPQVPYHDCAQAIASITFSMCAREDASWRVAPVNPLADPTGGDDNSNAAGGSDGSSAPAGP
jgi:hypothetical protein